MKKILLVEDDPGSVRLMSHVVKRGGFVMLFAGTGEEGVELARVEHPDIVLMDLGLPGIDGHEAMRRIRRFNTDVPIIAVTSDAMTGARERVLQGGFTGYIEKPYNPLTVLETILELARQWTAPSGGDMP